MESGLAALQSQGSAIGAHGQALVPVFVTHASHWLAAVQQTLSQHDAALPWLDALGEPTEPRHIAGALLRAVTHLLAWAKTRWIDVISYGLNDRLRFLWMWGHGKGLGRLV